MKNSTKLKIKAAGMLGAGILTANTLFGCKDPVNTPKPKLCECPNGTVHDEACACGGEDCTCTIRPDCACPDKAHLGIGETCDCGLQNCNCELKVYGQLANGVKIYRSGEVSDADMATAVANAQAGYEGMLAVPKGKLEGKLDEIHILPVSYDKNFFYKNINGSIVFGCKSDKVTEANILATLEMISAGDLPLEVSALKNTKGIKLAGIVPNAVRLSNRAVPTPRQNAALSKFVNG